VLDVMAQGEHILQQTVDGSSDKNYWNCQFHNARICVKLNLTISFFVLHYGLSVPCLLLKNLQHNISLET
jgi:hypothetical protein